MKNEKIINIYLLRHGQSKMNEMHIIQGQKVFPENSNNLTIKGVNQVIKSGNILNSLSIEKIFSSDLERCKETVKLLNLNIPVEFVEELREQNCGIWEGRNSREIFINDIKTKMDNEIEVVPEGGESIEEVSKRTINFLNQVVKKENLNNILLVTHGAVIQGILGYYLKIPNNHMFRIKVAAGSISHVILKGGIQPEIHMVGLR